MTALAILFAGCAHRAEPAPATASGGGPNPKACLAQEEVLNVLGGVQNDARICYERELVNDVGLCGKVVTVFVIAADGSVSSVEVAESTLGNAEVEACLVQVIIGLTFPPCSRGNAEITYPWIFRNGSPGECRVDPLSPAAPPPAGSPRG